MCKILKKDALHNRAYLRYELKVKISHCRPGQAVMAPGERGFQNLETGGT